MFIRLYCPGEGPLREYVFFLNLAESGNTLRWIIAHVKHLLVDIMMPFPNTILIHNLESRPLNNATMNGVAAWDS
jgi:hypothetical protein